MRLRAVSGDLGGFLGIHQLAVGAMAIL